MDYPFTPWTTTVRLPSFTPWTLRLSPVYTLDYPLSSCLLLLNYPSSTPFTPPELPSTTSFTPPELSSSTSFTPPEQSSSTSFTPEPLSTPFTPSELPFIYLLSSTPLYDFIYSLYNYTTYSLEYLLKNIYLHWLRLVHKPVSTCLNRSYRWPVETGWGNLTEPARTGFYHFSPVASKNGQPKTGCSPRLLLFWGKNWTKPDPQTLYGAITHEINFLKLWVNLER